MQVPRRPLRQRTKPFIFPVLPNAANQRRADARNPEHIYACCALAAFACYAARAMRGTLSSARSLRSATVRKYTHNETDVIEKHACVWATNYFYVREKPDPKDRQQPRQDVCE